MTPSKTSSPDVFLRKGVLKMGSKITGEHRCQSVISINCFSCWYILEAKIFQPKVCNFTKVTLIYGCFSRFLNCVNGIKLRNASQWSKLESYERFFHQISLSNGLNRILSKNLYFKYHLIILF